MAYPPLMRAVRYAWLCAALCATMPQASAQFNVYHPFPDSNAVWGMMAW